MSLLALHAKDAPSSSRLILEYPPTFIPLAYLQTASTGKQHGRFKTVEELDAVDGGAENAGNTAATGQGMKWRVFKGSGNEMAWT